VNSLNPKHAATSPPAGRNYEPGEGREHAGGNAARAATLDRGAGGGARVGRSRELFERAPGLLSVVRPLDLAELPTPITEEPLLAKTWGLASLHVKRDDLTSPVYGGSKLRSLEYFFGRARAAGASGVATMGPLGSHQVLATAVYARRIGLRSRSLLVPQPPVHEAELNARTLPSFGMEVVRCRNFFQVPFAYLRVRLTPLGGRRPFWIPPGSADPLGVLGVVEGALEVAQAVRRGDLQMPDDVVVATGTCATAAGLYLGFAIARLPVRVVAVRVVPLIITGSLKLKRMARRTLRILRRAGYAEEVRWGPVLWVNSMAGPGYSQPNPRSLAAMEDVARQGGFRTEVAYTGKTVALFRTDALRGRRVLFWNTFSAVEPALPVSDGARVVVP
jgi:D-cysteine desulfhydrase